jgi:hypothetical protein
VPQSTTETYDATPATGTTKHLIRAGAGQSGNLFELQNSGAATIGGIDLNSKASFSSYRFQGSTIAVLQSDFDAAHPLLLRSAGGIGWSSTTDWFGTPDVGMNRSAAGVLEVNSGAAGTLRDLKLRNVQAAGSSANPVCSAVGDVGKFWTDTTTTTTALKFCANKAGTIGWSAITLP